MMDSQENALLQGAQVEKEVEQTTAQNAEAAADDQKVENAKVYKTKKEVVERLKEIAASDENPDKDEIDLLKTVFYKLHITEREARMKEYIDGGGDPEAYQIMPDEDEETFKQQMAIVREKRARIFQQQEAEKQANLEKKLEIIEKIKAMATSPDEANKSYNEFKELQQQWKDIKNVPADRASELWRNYQLYVEQFYDLLKLNSEAREYDFKKNLETKTKLCEAAEKLADEEDVISAFHQLQELDQQYRETGPVAKELREQIWTRFKAASTVINKRHQQHFEDLRSKEEENLTLKTALCEKVEEISKLENKTASDWEKRSKEIINIQNQWKTIGFAPQKMNVKIFERFRAACDDFFGRKSEFFKEMKQAYAANIEKKKALVEKAQALADSTDWKVTSDKLINLQKEWKTIGVVPKKIGDQLWHDFLNACNKFFEARNAANAGARNEERENLEKKRSIIEQIKALVADAANATREKVQALTDEYNKVGHVPYKEKDALYAAYHEALDAIYKELNISNKRRRLDDFKSNIRNMAKRGEDAIDNERGRLTRRFEQLKQEIQTYENNLGFLNASSKKGNSLIDEMNRKVQKLRDDLELVRQKIKAIDTENK
ncbi:DUF349 domain-containing protein [Prevotella sp.]|uniref:DUF349 domain-containing protein n=1 Tax=Prevotella sp. TaxID=59823 RepID=UPI0025CD40F7|nr:DUF349 domain-containing protein [Prevotella sp.]